MACWRHVCDLPAYDPCCYHAQFQEVCYQKHTNLRFSGQCKWQGNSRGTAWGQQGNGRGTAWYVWIGHNRPPRAQRGSRVVALLIINLGARRGWVVSTTPRPLYPREKPGTHCTGGWVGPRAGLYVCEKSRPIPGSDSRTVQSVVSRCTDWATRP
jgi:hypothetical protein